MSNHRLQASVHDFQPLRQPFTLERSRGAAPDTHTLARGVDQLAAQINERLEALDAKLYGRIALTDLNGTTRDYLSNKLDAQGVSSWIQQHPEAVTASVNKQEIFLDPQYLKDKVWRGTSPPVNPIDGMLWIDPSSSPSQIKSWDGASWQQVGMVPEDYYTMAQTNSLFQQTADEIALKVSTSTYNLDKVYRGAMAPDDPAADTLWLDTSQNPNLLKRWTGSAWVSAGADKVKTSGITIQDDEVTIATPNFNLELQNSSGDTVMTMSADGAGFDQLYADRVISPSVISIGPSSSRSYNIGNGNTYTTLSDLLDALSGVNPGDITATFTSDVTDAARLAGKSFRSLTVNLNGHTLYGSIYLYNVSGGVVITGGTISDNRSAGGDYSALVYAYCCPNVTANALILNGNQKATFGVISYFSRVMVSDCDIHHISSARWNSAAINGEYASDLTVLNTKGTAKYGIYLSVGSIALATVARPAGTTGHIYNSRAYYYEADPAPAVTASGYENLPAPAVPTTLSWTATGGGTARSDGYVQADVYQGQWSGGATKCGLWFFDYASIQSALAGKTIQSVRFTCTRYADSNGSSAAGAPTFRLHNLTSIPASIPSLQGTATKSTAWARGDRKSITLPTAFAEAIRAGTAKGIAIYNGSTGPYLKFQPGNAVLEVTYL